mmetsp:Transcript_4446/g.14584  ORF Transcript_4446/g.14584 Transcript_4446/m.14584 type:complete len:235 (-) Transcript_4446:862-1566(-)|eukprot:scaffold24515_cov112-Isochrysis_galbana.AAC.4
MEDCQTATPAPYATKTHSHSHHGSAWHSSEQTTSLLAATPNISAPVPNARLLPPAIHLAATAAPTVAVAEVPPATANNQPTAAVPNASTMIGATTDGKSAVIKPNAALVGTRCHIRRSARSAQSEPAPQRPDDPQKPPARPGVALAVGTTEWVALAYPSGAGSRAGQACGRPLNCVRDEPWSSSPAIAGAISARLAYCDSDLVVDEAAGVPATAGAARGRTSAMPQVHTTATAV